MGFLQSPVTKRGVTAPPTQFERTTVLPTQFIDKTIVSLTQFTDSDCAADPVYC